MVSPKKVPAPPKVPSALLKKVAENMHKANATAANAAAKAEARLAMDKMTKSARTKYEQEHLMDKLRYNPRKLTPGGKNKIDRAILGGEKAQTGTEYFAMREKGKSALPSLAEQIANRKILLNHIARVSARKNYDSAREYKDIGVGKIVELSTAKKAEMKIAAALDAAKKAAAAREAVAKAENKIAAGAPAAQVAAAVAVAKKESAKVVNAVAAAAPAAPAAQIAAAVQAAVDPAKSIVEIAKKTRKARSTSPKKRKSSSRSRSRSRSRSSSLQSGAKKYQSFLKYVCARGVHRDDANEYWHKNKSKSLAALKEGCCKKYRK